MRHLRIGIVAVVLVFGFGYYGVNEIRDALEMGTSLRSGVEGLALAAFFATILGVMVWREVRPRKRPKRLDADPGVFS